MTGAEMLFKLMLFHRAQYCVVGGSINRGSARKSSWGEGGVRARAAE